MKIKVFYILIILSFLGSFVIAQENYLFDSPYDSAYSELKKDVSFLKTTKNKFNFDFSVDMGYMYSDYYGSNQYMQFNSLYKRKINPKLDLITGSKIMFSRTLPRCNCENI